MSTHKVKKFSGTVISTEIVNSIIESSDPENIDSNLINNYQELSEKCDKVITKIKNRKLKVIK
jgi:hypothetical protein